MADDQHTGGMVALLPTASDAQKLVVDGGETAEAMHVTLQYLGDDVTSWDGPRRDSVLAAARQATSRLTGPLQARAFAHATFNPEGGSDGDRTSCAVYLIGDASTPSTSSLEPTPYYERDLLTDVHEQLTDRVRDALRDDAQDQHRPFFPHITGGYGLTAGDLTYTGPLTFDRVAVFFGPTHYDIPLSSSLETSLSMSTPTPPAGGTPSAKDIRDAVNAYSRVAAVQQPAYRARVIAMARRAGQIALIPDAWLSGRPGSPANPGGNGG